MSEEREDLKGNLLLLWLEDLKNDKAPGSYPGMESLTAEEISEFIGLARFLKAVFYPSEAPFCSADDYAKGLTEKVLEEWKSQMRLTRALIERASSFGQLVREAIQLLQIDRTGLADSVGFTESKLFQLETGQSPPHSLPTDVMLKLLGSLHIACKEVVLLIRRSCIDWATVRKHIDGEALVGELGKIESYCSRLESILPS